jgi:hypothetical protein
MISYFHHKVVIPVVIILGNTFIQHIQFLAANTPTNWQVLSDFLSRLGNFAYNRSIRQSGLSRIGQEP